MMTSYTTNASKPNYDIENNVDRISNLPDPILELIISGIPATEEVIRTSVLSKRWRYLWTSIPSFSSLDIDCSRRLNPHTTFEKEKFKDFVSWALENKSNIDLDSFRLCCSSYYSLATVKQWIQAAVLRNVKLLDLMFCTEFNWESIVFHRCLETCDSLESLRLDVFGHALILSRSARFTALKVLELNKVYSVNCNLFEQFLKSSPILEDLGLRDCYMISDGPLCISSLKLKNLRVHNCKSYEGFWSLKVSCPKLVVLEYVNCPRARLIFENLDSLKNVVILPQYNLEEKVSSYLGDTLCKLLVEISHVESLSLNLYFIQAIDAALDLKRNFPASLPNLKTLDITTTIDTFTMNVIIRILKCSPVLESLNLIIQKECITAECSWDLYEFETTRILTRHLKRVEFLEFNGEKHKLDIARLLLEEGIALEEMVFTSSDKDKYHEKSTETINQVSKFPKASLTVKVVARLQIPQNLFNHEPRTLWFSYNS